MDAGAGRIQDDDVGVAVTGDEFSVQDIFHVPGEERTVVDPIGGRIGLRIFDCLRNIFNANDFRCLSGDELGDGSGAGIEVVHHLVPRQGGEFAGDAVQPLGLERIGLVEGLRADLETQAFHLFVDGFVTPVQDRGLVADGVVQFLIQGRNLREGGRDGVQQGFPPLRVFVGEADDEHDGALLGRPDKHVAEITAVFADVIELVTVFDAEALDKQPDSIGRLRLKVALPDVQDLVEKLSDMEAQSHPVVLRNSVGVFVA